MNRFIIKRNCVYVVGYLEIPHIYKIGSTGDLEKRLKSMQVGSPYELLVVMAIPTTVPQALEQHLHKRFTEARVRGEWFRLNSCDLDEIANSRKATRYFREHTSKPIVALTKISDIPTALVPLFKD